MGALEVEIRSLGAKQGFIPIRKIILRTVLAKAPQRTTMKGGMCQGALLEETP
jgi:hypothetical protein